MERHLRREAFATTQLTASPAVSARAFWRQTTSAARARPLVALPSAGRHEQSPLVAVVPLQHNPWRDLLSAEPRVPVASSGAARHHRHGPPIPPRVYRQLVPPELQALRQVDLSLNYFRSGLPVLRSRARTVAADEAQRDLYHQYGWSYAQLKPRFRHEVVWKLTTLGDEAGTCINAACARFPLEHRAHLLKGPNWHGFELNTVQYHPPEAQLASLKLRELAGLSATSDYSFLDDEGEIFKAYWLACLHGKPKGDQTLSEETERYFWRKGRRLIAACQLHVDMRVRAFRDFGLPRVALDRDMIQTLDQFLIAFARTITPRLKLTPATPTSKLVDYYQYLSTVSYQGELAWPVWLIARLHFLFMRFTHLPNFHHSNNYDFFPHMHFLWAKHIFYFDTASPDKYVPFSIFGRRNTPYPIFTSLKNHRLDPLIALAFTLIFLPIECPFCDAAPRPHNRQPHRIYGCGRWWRQRDYDLKKRFRAEHGDGIVGLKAKRDPAMWQLAEEVCRASRDLTAMELDMKNQKIQQKITDALTEFHFMNPIIESFSMFFERVMNDPEYLSRYGTTLPELVQQYGNNDTPAFDTDLW